jgi:hypothetical protein
MKNQTTQGLGNKNLLSFPKHHSFKYWRLKSNVNCHINTICKSMRSLSWSFSDLFGSKWCLQRKYMCRQHETLDCRKLHKQLWQLSCKLMSHGSVKETMSTTMHLFTFYLESDGMSTNNDYKHFFGALSLQFC